MLDHHVLRRPPAPILFYRFAPSGHCHRVELLLSLLELPVEMVDVDLPGREHKTPGFLHKNPFGQVPVIEDGTCVLADSNAILVYLAAEYGGGRWTPASNLLAAEQQRWFSVAAGPLAFGPAAARAHVVFGSPHDLAAVQSRGRALLQVMNAHLAARPFLLGDTLSLADVANYAYVARAPAGGIELADYREVSAWLERIESTPRFVPMPWRGQPA